MWGHQVLPAALPVPFSTTLSLAPLVYLCANVGQQGLLVVRLPALFVPHSTSLGPPQPCESSPPRLPVSAPPTGLDECLFFISLVSDFLAIRSSASSGRARRRSVSTYATILVLPRYLFLKKHIYLREDKGGRERRETLLPLYIPQPGPNMQPRHDP